MALWVFRTCRPVNLSTWVDRSREKYRSAGPVYQKITALVLDNGLIINGSWYHNALAFATLSSLLPSYIYAALSTFQQCYYQGDIWSINSIAGGLGGLPPRRRIVSIALRSCSSLDLSTCLKGLTGQQVNVLYQGIMG